MSTVAPIDVNKLLGLDEEYNFLNPKFAPGTLDPAVSPVAPATKPPLSEALRNHYNATAETPLGADQLPSPVPIAPETIQAGKSTLQKGAEAIVPLAKSAYNVAETGAGYLNNAIRGHVKFLTDIGEGLTTSAAGLVTGGAGMATAASDVLNTAAARVAREGFTALAPGYTEGIKRLPGEDLPLPAERSPTHFRDIFTRMEERSKAYSFEPKSEAGKKTAEIIALVPEAVKGVSDFVAKRAEDLGLDPDKARVVSFGMELLTFYALDRGVRTAAPGIRSKVADLRTKVKNAKTDGDLLSPEVVDSATRLAESVNAHPEAGPALDAARARLIETLKQPARNLTETLRRRAEQMPPEAPAAPIPPAEPPALGISARARERIAAREQVADPLAQARAAQSPPTPRTTVDDVISGRTEAAAVTAPTATPAPAVGDPTVAAAVPVLRERIMDAYSRLQDPNIAVRRAAMDEIRNATTIGTSLEEGLAQRGISPQISYNIRAIERTLDPGLSTARSLFQQATDAGVESKLRTSAASELKTLARESAEGANLRTGLQKLGFSPEEIRTIEPRLKAVRAAKAVEPELVPTSPTTPATATAPDALVSPEVPTGTPVRGALDFGGMFSDLAGAISGSFKDMLWDQYQKGSNLNVARTPELSLEVAKALKDSGLEVPRSRFDSMVTEIEQIRATASEQGLRGEAFRQPLTEYYNTLKRELEEGRRVDTETAQPGTQITQTPEGELVYSKPNGEVITPVEQLPAHQELARAPTGSEVTLPPAPGIVDTAPVIEKPKRSRKIVKAKEEVSPVTAEEAVTEVAARVEAETGTASAPGGEFRTKVDLVPGAPDDIHSFLMREGDATASAIKNRAGYTLPEVNEALQRLTAEGRVEPVQAGNYTRYRAIDKPGAPTPAAGEPVVAYYPVRSMTELGDRLGGPIAEAGTAAPERAAIQVRSSKAGAKPDALFVDTAGLNTLTRLADIEKQVASGRMSKEVGDMSIANLRRQAELGDLPLSEAHTFNGQRLQREAVLTADMLGLDLYVKKGKNYELMPKDALKAEAKLSRGDITTPSGVTRDEAAALADFKSRPIGPEQLKEILESSEKGIDISDRLPADLAPHYKTLLESERQGINTSERRNFIDVLKDVNTVLGESGAVGPRGPGVFSRDRRMAAQRLEADARRTGNRFIDMFRNRLDPAEIPMFERYLERISNPEPPKGVGPGRMNLDPDAIARGDQIVKHRINADGKAEGPPLWESDVIPLYDAADIGRSTFRFLENPIYLFERMKLKDPIYYAYRTAQDQYNQSLNAMRKDLKSMRSYFSPSSRERIGAYGYSKSPEGMRLLEARKIEAPNLNPAEMRAYNEIRGVYEDFYNRINEVRESTGHEPLMKVDNYFTFARSYSIMEKLGIVPDMLRHPPADINAQFLNHSTTPFPHERFRSGSTYAAEFDAFRLMDRYASSSLKQIHVAPFVAKLNELIETKLPDPKQTNKPWTERDMNWSLKEENPNVYNTLHSWKEYIATGQSESFRLPKKVENFITTVGNNLAYSLLSANLRSAGVQISTVRNTFQSLGYIPTLEGITRSAADLVTGGGRWNRAMEKSEILSSRRFQDAFSGMEFTLTGFKPRELVGAIARGRFTELQSAAASAGMKFLEVIDMTSANVSWNAAFDHYLKKIGKDERGAIRYADDLVVKTQGSTMPGDLAAIQRSVAGKALTQFQTFLISDWNFLSKEVLGVGDKKMTNTQMAVNAAKFIGTTSAFNVLFENVLGVQSPFPTPVKDIKRAIASSDDDPLKIAWTLAGGAVEVVPIIGASRYGKSVAGPAVNTLYDFSRALSGAPLAPSPYEPLAKMAGVPGTQQIAKTVRARKRGENWYNSLMGWYSEEEAGSNERSGRSGGGRGR